MGGGGKEIVVVVPPDEHPANCCVKRVAAGEGELVRQKVVIDGTDNKEDGGYLVRGCREGIQSSSLLTSTTTKEEGEDDVQQSVLKVKPKVRHYYKTVLLPPAHVWLLSDNYDAENPTKYTDSNTKWGAVSYGLVTGVVIGRIWPFFKWEVDGDGG